MLDLRWRELHRLRIAMRGKPVNDGPPGISEPEKLSDFVEGLAGGIVASVADIFVSPRIILLGGEIQVRMAARNHQRQHRELQFVITFLALLEEHSVNMSFEMVHGDQGLVEREC